MHISKYQHLIRRSGIYASQKASLSAHTGDASGSGGQKTGEQAQQESPWVKFWLTMKEYGGVAATVGGSAAAIITVTIYFERSRKYISDLEKQLSKSEALYEADKRLLEEKLRSAVAEAEKAVAEAEKRTAEKFLMFGYSKEYQYYEETVKAQAKANLKSQEPVNTIAK
jgi:hypothetical protein